MSGRFRNVDRAASWSVAAHVKDAPSPGVRSNYIRTYPLKSTLTPWKPPFLRLYVLFGTFFRKSDFGASARADMKVNVDLAVSVSKPTPKRGFLGVS